MARRVGRDVDNAIGGYGRRWRNSCLRLRRLLVQCVAQRRAHRGERFERKRDGEQGDDEWQELARSHVWPGVVADRTAL